MNRKAFWFFRSVFVLSAMLVLGLGSVQAQQCTPGQVLQCDPGGSGAPVDSAITQDPATGNVGIGTTNPITTLHVTGNATNANQLFRIQNTALGGGIWDIGEMFAPRILTFRNIESGTPLMNLVGNSGNVGIGTMNPSSPGGRDRVLDVAATNAPGFVLRSNNPSYTNPAWELLLQIASPTETQFAINNGTTSRFTIDSSGWVGIGTTTPQANLDVNGNIRAGNLVVDGNIRAGQIQATQGTPIYTSPAGCGGGLTLASSCRTLVCDRDRFYNCSGACQAISPDTCSTTLVGRLVAP